jgi:hypothetical protein
MRIDLSSFKTNKEPKDSFYYTSLGKENFIDDNGIPCEAKESDNTFAKKIKNKKSKTLLNGDTFSYFIKAYAKNKLYNPYEKHTIEDVNKPNRIEQTCKKTSYFITVNESIFNKYINYLKTQNKKWLVEAQKDII